jgi:hypothetical protein
MEGEGTGMNKARFLTVQSGGGTTPTGFNFDQGSGAIAEVSTDVYRITPRAHWDSKWAWWALRSGKFAGKTPHFLIAKASHFNMVANEWLACWAAAADTDTWYNFDNVTIGATDLEFYHNSAFPGGTIYIAAMPMYPFSRTQRKVAEWTANALASSPASATAYVIGNATARDNGDTRGTIPALPYYGIKFANATANTKNKAILASGNHPSENIGRFMFEGAVDWLLTTGYKQKVLLDWFEIWGYPCLNPQGVYGGWWRSSPQTPTSDNNRLWDTTGTNEAVDAFKTAWNTDVSNAVEAALDFHSWMAADGNKGEAGDSTTAIWAAYIAAVTALDAAYSQRADETTASKLGNYWRAWDVSKLTGHPDHGGVTTLGPTEWKLAGRRFIEALADMVAAGRFANNPGVGSRDFNGTTDRIDWANVDNLKGDALTISAWVLPSSTPSTVNEYVVCLHDASDASNGITLNLINSGDKIDFVRTGATGDYLWYDNSATVTRDAWNHILVTSDGGLLSGSAALYVRGSAIVQSFTNGSGAEKEHTGSWSIGGRVYSDTRNLEGRIAQVGVWNRVLNATEIANLAAGYAPDLAAASGLQFYFKGNTSSLAASPGGTGTADGTTSVTGVGNGPTIYYP